MVYKELLMLIEKNILENDMEQAERNAKEAVERNRLNLQANLLLADIFYTKEEWLESYRYYSILYHLQTQYQEYIMDEEKLLKRIDKTMEMAVNFMNKLPLQQREEFLIKLRDVNADDKNLLENFFVINEELEHYFGLHNFNDKKYYLARYDNWSGSYRKTNYNQNGVVCKSEIYEIEFIGNEYIIKDNIPCILPIVTNHDSSINQIYIEEIEEGKKFEFFNTIQKTYSYFRIDKPLKIKSQHNMVFGKPIFLGKCKKNKKLVLNIFMDSFNWDFIKRGSFQKMMPNTYEFFSSGIICNEFYSGSEFTYPSVASYWTGLPSTKHHVLNQNVHFPIPKDIPVLSEIFQEHGYFTAKIGGNDSVVPNYGYIRGVDRFLYEKSEQNFHVQDTIYEAIEHMEAFKETDNFMWIEIQDLHEVAGYWAMPLSVQTKVSLESNEIDNEGGSSLYQTPSLHRREVYGKQLQHIDMQLGILYDYVKKNYKKEDVVITLIADHGNGFNVEEGQPFMSAQRTNVPLMIYCDGNYEHICDEKIETIDYGHILCKLAGIEDERIKKNDGRLPVFFGGSEKRKYIFSQSLFPKRKYEVGIIGEKYKFYFRSSNMVENDCTVDISKGEYIVLDENDNIVENTEIFEQCLNIMISHLGDYLKK